MQVIFLLLYLYGSTDCSYVENMMLVVVYCDCYSSDEIVHSRMTYLTVDRPSSSEGLVASFENALHCLGVPSLDAIYYLQKVSRCGNWWASANIATQGLKRLDGCKLEWISWMWCLAYWLELAIKDALTGTVFDHVNEMLTHLFYFYMYTKSAKKCRRYKILLLAYNSTKVWMIMVLNL